MSKLGTLRPIEEMNAIDNMNAQDLRLHGFHTIETIKAGIRSTVIANETDINGLVAIVGSGTGLMEDTPGKGKTTIAKAIAGIIGGQFRRVQGTPELMPSDVQGYEYYEDTQMKFKPGPILEADMLLFDEGNRATGKTQSAFLEAMAEKQVTVSGETYPLHDPFTMIITQNPFAQGETHELPLGELDRIAVSLKMTQTREDKKRIMQRHAGPQRVNDNNVSLHDVRGLRKAMTKVEIPDSVYEYILDLEEGIQNHEDVDLEKSIIDGRAKLFIMDIARCMALSRAKGVANVMKEDAWVAAQYAYPHRIGLTLDAQEKHFDRVEAAKAGKAEAKFTEDPVMNVVHDVLKSTK